jgi:hypothetical protein
MKHSVISFSPALIAALFALPLAAWADANPDFDDDAKPILRMQPGLLQYVESRFDVKDTGTAKYPGDDDRRPGPPFIFRARPLGSNGPYNLRLLIQPGRPGHILGVVDITKVHVTAPATASSQPSVANQPPPQAPAPVSEAPPAAQAPAPSTPPPAQQPSEPTADTPSGPIMGAGSQAPSSTPSSTQPSLEPPPDPAPATH